MINLQGWLDDFQSEGPQLVAEAYMKRNDHNFIVVDWGQYSFSTLKLAVLQASIISRIIGKSLLKLFDLGLDPKQVHCVGHSIGGETKVLF
jgi:hypothetical protein